MQNVGQQQVSQNVASIRPPQPANLPVSTLADQFSARMDSLRDQLGRVLSVIDPSSGQSPCTAQPKQAGIYGQLVDGLDTLGIVEKQVAELGARLSG